MISYEEALSKVLDSVSAIGTERIALEDAHTRTLAETVVSSVDLPLFDNSAVDGFAVHADDLPGTLKLVGTVPAGETAGFELQRGTTAKVMTGAQIPVGADAMVMREDVEEYDGNALFKHAIDPGAHVRAKGEEIRAGDKLFDEGSVCSPPVIALLAAAGTSKVDVYRRPTAGVLVTGDELASPGTELRLGQIYESNGIALKTALAELGIEAKVARTKDDLESTVSEIESLTKECDLLITTGGVSVGDFDVVRRALEEVGANEMFWRVAVKPGKPVCFSTIGRDEGQSARYVFGLPGNPVSALVTFALFVAPAIEKMQGTNKIESHESGALSHDWRHSTGRLEFARAYVTRNGDGADVSLEACQASHMLSGLANANALAVLAADVESFVQGDMVDVRDLPWRTKR